MTPKILLIPTAEFQRIHNSSIEKYEKLAVLADMCRANTLAAIKHAGSGHIGSSFSSLDIVATLYYSIMNTVNAGLQNSDRDIYFSSKGHDAPGLYAVLYSLGILSKEKFTRLRRLNGAPGHPDIDTIGVEANTGSLGMGISKGRGMAFAKRMHGNKGRVFVMTGDGELQEGQIYESLQNAVHQHVTELYVIVDHNKVQSDKLVSDVSDLGDLTARFRAFGWHVARCNGHDVEQLDRTLVSLQGIKDKPKILIADTVKGKGVSFMEHPAALQAGAGLYRWHSGAPDDASFISAHQEIIARLNQRLELHGLPNLESEDFPEMETPPRAVTRDSVGDAFGEALAEIASERRDVIVLDADLATDCRLRSFEKKYPERLIENGIAEQDMASMAGGLALQGFLPVVNSFGAFLAARANEQIYNNCTEQKKIIYVCHYTGLLPAGPGHSHQSVRDISLFASLPNMLIVQPANALETKMLLEYCIQQARESCMMRLVIGPSPGKITLPPDYKLRLGRGVAMSAGNDVVIFAYGPVMLFEALRAAEILQEKKIGAKVVNMPWLNRIDAVWLRETINGNRAVYVLEDHSPIGGLGDRLLDAMSSIRRSAEVKFRKLGVNGVPACGSPPEVLSYHRLDAFSIAQRVREDLHFSPFD